MDPFGSQLFLESTFIFIKFIYLSVNCTTAISFYLEIEPFNQQMLQFQMICVIAANVIELSRFPRRANCALVRNDFSIIYFLITSLYRKSSKLLSMVLVRLNTIFRDSVLNFLDLELKTPVVRLCLSFGKEIALAHPHPGDFSFETDNLRKCEVIELLIVDFQVLGEQQQQQQKDKWTKF